MLRIQVGASHMHAVHETRYACQTVCPAGTCYEFCDSPGNGVLSPLRRSSAAVLLMVL